MNIDSFLRLFIAVSYNSHQGIFDYMKLEDFLIYDDSNEYDDETKEILSEQFENLIEKCKIEGIIEEISGHSSLCRISKNFNSSGTIDWFGMDLASDMQEFLYCYISGIHTGKIKIQVGREK